MSDGILYRVTVWLTEAVARDVRISASIVLDVIARFAAINCVEPMFDAQGDLYAVAASLPA